MTGRRQQLFAILMVAVMLAGGVAAFSGSAAAQQIDSNGDSVQDLNAGASDASHIIVPSDGGNIKVTASSGNQHGIAIDLSNLEDAGVNVDNAAIEQLTIDSSETDGTVNDAFIEDGEIRIIFTGGGNGNDLVIAGGDNAGNNAIVGDNPTSSTGGLVLSGIDTTGVSTTNVAGHQIKLHNEDPAFQNAANRFSRTDDFRIVDIENTDTDETFSTIQGAIDDSDTDAGDTIEVAEGTYNEQLTVDKGVNLVATGDTNDTLITHTAGDNEETVSIQSDGVTLDGFTVERVDDNSATAGATQVIAVREAPGTGDPVEITNNDVNFDGNDNAGQAFGIYVRDGNIAPPPNGDLGSQDVKNVVIENNEIAGIDSDDTTGPDNGFNEFAAGIGIAADEAQGGVISDITIQDNNVSANERGVSIGAFGGSDDDLAGDIEDVVVSDNEFGANKQAVYLADTATASADVDPTEITIETNSFDDNEVQFKEDLSDRDADLGQILSDNTFNESITITDESANELVTNIYGTDFDKALGAIPGGNNDYTVDVSAGEFVSDSIAELDTDPSGVSVVGASNGITNVTVDHGGDVIELDDGTSDGTVSSVIVSNLNIQELEDETGSSLIDATSDPDITDLEVTNNVINGIDDVTVIDLSSQPGSIDGTIDIEDNTFTPAGDVGSPDYTAVDLGDDLVASGADATVSVSDNLIEGVDGGLGIVAEIDDGGNTADVTISSNDITGITGATAIDLASNNGIDSIESLTIDQNTIEAADDDTDANGIDIDYDEQGDEVELTNNEIIGVGGVALGLEDKDDNPTATVTGNTFDDNGKHIDYSAANTGNGDFDPATLVSDNTYVTLAFVTDTEDGTPTDNLASQILYGQLGSATDDGSGTDVLVEAGTYVVDSQLDLSDGSNNDLLSIDGADSTTIVASDTDTLTFGNADVTVDGFTFESEEDGGVGVTLNGGATLTNSTFVGDSFTSRTAVSATADGEISNVDISGYGTGISASDETVAVRDSTVSDSETGISISSDDTVEVVRNTVTDNLVGISITDNDQTHQINFNDIVTNEDAGVQLASADEIDTLLANWWGSETGPNITTNQGPEADIVENAEDDVSDTSVRPWLTQSVSDTLEGVSEDELVVITDPTSIPADADETSNNEGALVLVAAPQLDAPADVDDFGDITMVLDESPDSDKLLKISPDGSQGDGTAGSPYRSGNVGTGESVAPEDNTPGDYVIRAVGTDNINSEQATQSFTAPIGGVEVSTDLQNDELPADDETEMTVTLQLVDAEGNPVERSDVDTRFSIPSSQRSDAGVSITDNSLGTEIDTDANGQSSFSLTADTAGETLDITAVDRDNDNADSITVDTVEPAQANFTLALVDGPTTITQNESYSATLNVTNVGDGAGTQDITYDLEDSTGISQLSATEEDVQLDAGASQEITFEVAASDTQSLSTDDDYAHVFESDDDTLTIENITVEEDAPAYYTLKLSNSIADRDVHAAIISIFSTHRQSGSTALLPHSVYRYTRTHTGGQR